MAEGSRWGYWGQWGVQRWDTCPGGRSWWGGRDQARDAPGQQAASERRGRSEGGHAPLAQGGLGSFETGCLQSAGIVWQECGVRALGKRLSFRWGCLQPVALRGLLTPGPVGSTLSLPRPQSF